VTLPYFNSSWTHRDGFHRNKTVCVLFSIDMQQNKYDHDIVTYPEGMRTSTVIQSAVIYNKINKLNYKTFYSTKKKKKNINILKLTHNAG
jgi:hypothetical protein